MKSQILNYQVWIPSFTQFQLCFQGHHKKLVKTNEIQSNITKTFNSIFHKKVTTDCCDPSETLADTKDYNITEVISIFIEMKFRKSSGNVNYSKFPPGWTELCNMHWVDGKFKLFSAGSSFKDQIFTGELSRLDATGVLRHGVITFTTTLIYLIELHYAICNSCNTC